MKVEEKSPGHLLSEIIGNLVMLSSSCIPLLHVLLLKFTLIKVEFTVKLIIYKICEKILQKTFT